jgi:hypothetical protein
MVARDRIRLTGQLREGPACGAFLRSGMARVPRRGDDPPVNHVPPTRVPLDPPWILRDDERALLEIMVRGPFQCAELEEQLATVQVSGHCDCGCPSISLATGGPRVPRELVRAWSPTDRDDYFEISAVGRSPAGMLVDVHLHVANGLVDELEIWAGSSGGPPEAEVPELSTIRFE